MAITPPLRLITRKSPMAMWQAEHIKTLLIQHHPELSIDIIGMTTEGDRRTDVPLQDIGGKGLFVKGLQAELLNHQADFAVHCIKDMSVHALPGLSIAAIGHRDDPRDALISNHFNSVDELPEGANIGTSSPRRQSLLKALRPDLNVTMLRGNVNTRLSKLDNGDYDAILLSACGLHRIGLGHRIKMLFDPEFFIPAIGQGALALECRTTDNKTLGLLSCLNHEPSSVCIAAERAVNQRLGGDCHTPIGAYARLDGEQMHIKAFVGDQHGTLLVTEAIGPKENAQLIGIKAADDLIARGANDML